MLPHDGRVVRPQISMGFADMEESSQGVEARSKDYWMLSNTIKSQAIFLSFAPSSIDGLRLAPAGQTICESDAEDEIDEEIVMDKQGVDDARSSL